MMTMGALALGIGLMIDNAIVVLDNIYRHRQMGYSKIEAAKVGAGEVASAVIAVTLTTCFVFLPIVFVQGFAAELFSDFALTVAFAIAMSLMVALTLIPMLASKLLVIEADSTEKSRNPLNRVSELVGIFLERLNVKYRALLVWALGHRKTVIAIVSVVMISSLALASQVGMTFLPNSDAGEISVRIDLARGTVIEETNALSLEIEEYLNTFPEVERIFTSVAPPRGGFFGGVATERISINIMLVDRSQRDRDSILIADEMRTYLALIPGAEVRISATDMAGMGGGAPIQIRVSGSDLDVLLELAEEVRSSLETVPGIREAEIPATEGDPEYRIYVDRAMAAQYGLNVAQVANTARIVLGGQVATRYRTGATEIDVRVMYPERNREGLGALMDTYITSPAGIQVPLRMVAEVQSGTGLASILRLDQVRTVTVSAQIIGRDLGSVMVDIEEVLAAEVQVPRGYSVQLGGDMEEMVDAFISLILALILAILLVYMVMAAQFESLMYPFIIMFTIPTTFIGVILSLVITGRELSVTTFIGIIMVIGIVVNNGIILVDYINILRRRGMERNEAILTAGPIRLRPILMTATSTILALMPIALGIGIGAELMSPMATVVVGGLLVSSVFTLVLIPVVYTLFDDFANWVRKKLGLEGDQFSNAELTELDVQNKTIDS